MKVKESLSTLINKHMEKSAIGDSRLASQVNSLVGNPYFIHRSTLRNWRDGTSLTVGKWPQLVAVAAVLGLSKNDANELLESGGCPPLLALSTIAKESEQSLFNNWLERESEIQRYRDKRAANDSNYQVTNPVCQPDAISDPQKLRDH